jgi:hypothetical protein
MNWMMNAFRPIITHDGRRDHGLGPIAGSASLHEGAMALRLLSKSSSDWPPCTGQSMQEATVRRHDGRGTLQQCAE